MIENKKRYFMIVGVFCIISSLIGGTLAWYTWQSSNNTTVSFTVEGVDVIFDAGADITSSKLRPVSTKEVGVEKGYAIEKTITASSSVIAYLNLYLTLETLPDGLKNESFKYVLLSSSDNTHFEEVASGNFKDKSNGMVSILSSYPAQKGETYFKFIIYMDGNMENPVNMMGKSFSATLNVTVGEN